MSLNYTDEAPPPTEAGAPPRPHKRQRTEEEESSLSPSGLAAGSRLEVLWDIEPPEGGGVRAVWWGCVFLGSAGRNHTLSDEEGQRDVPVFRVRYDAMPDFGYSAADVADPSDILVTSDRMLYDVSFDGALWWRQAGDAWEPATSPLDQASLGASPSTTDEDAAGVTTPMTLEGITVLVNSVVQQAFVKHEKRLEKLPAEAQMQALDQVSLFNMHKVVPSPCPPHLPHTAHPLCVKFFQHLISVLCETRAQIVAAKEKFSGALFAHLQRKKESGDGSAIVASDVQKALEAAGRELASAQGTARGANNRTASSR